MGQNPLEQLKAWTTEDFGVPATRIFSLCLNEEGKKVACFDHFKLAQASTKLSANRFLCDSLHKAYVYLAGYYLCVDSIIDGHSRAGSDGDPREQVTPLLGCLLSKSIEYFLQVIRASAKDREADFMKLMSDLFIQNSLALDTEIAAASGANDLSEADNKACIIGRSNLFPFLFEVCWMVSGDKPDASLLSIASELTVYFQLGDDVSDWREDFRCGKRSSFLRDCFSAIGASASEAELEETIYVGGKYERHMSRIISGLDHLKESCDERRYDELGKFVQDTRTTLETGLREFVKLKLSYAARAGER